MNVVPNVVKRGGIETTALPQRDNVIRRRYLSYGGQVEGIKRLVLVLALMVCGGALWAVAPTWSGVMPPKTEIDLADRLRE